MNILLPWTCIQNTPYRKSPEEDKDYFVRCLYYTSGAKYPGMYAHAMKTKDGFWLPLALGRSGAHLIIGNNVKFDNMKFAQQFADDKLVKAGWILLNEGDPLAVLI